MRYHKQAITLIELIIVVTIIAILGVFWTIYISSNISDSRDTVRLSDLKSMERALGLYEIKQWSYPSPDNALQITYAWWNIWKQWSFGEEVYRAVKVMSNIPLDPITGQQYSYSVLSNNTAYQIASVFESSDLSSQIPGIDSAYAASNTAYLAGNYNNTLLNAGTSLIALPSITTSVTSQSRLEDILSSHNLVIDGGSNLPAAHNSNGDGQYGQVILPEDYIIFEWSLVDIETIEQKVDFITKLQAHYSQISVPTRSTQTYSSLMDIDLADESQVEKYFQYLKMSHVF